MEYDQIAVLAETVIAPEFPTVGYGTYCDLGIADCKHIAQTQYMYNKYSSGSGVLFANISNIF